MTFRHRVVAGAVALLCAGALGAATLQGSEWQPLVIDSKPVAESAGLFIQFRSRGRLAGFGGCNRLDAAYRTRAENITIGPVAVTLMRCAEDLMTREARLTAALERARSFLRDRTRLVVYDGAGRPLLEMRQTDWD